MLSALVTVLVIATPSLAGLEFIEPAPSAAQKEGPVGSQSAEADRREFESLRETVRNRRTAETESETVNDAAPAAPAPKKSTRARPATFAKPAAKPAARPVATPEMVTETITPQGSAPATLKDVGRPDEPNPAFSYTHLLPSPFNVPQGALIVGTSLTYGVFDFFQVSTDLMRTLNEQWNFQAKVPLIEYPTFMATAFVGYENFNPRNISGLNPDIRYARWQPGLTTAYELGRDMALFLGGNFSFGKDPVPVVRKSGFLRGARVEADWSWLYNPESSRLADNAIAAGVSYDLTYQLLGFGVTHHWRNFQLGVHYTLADTNRFLPIVGFQAGATF